MKPLAYSIPQRVVHWLTTLLIFFNLLLPGQIERVADLLDGGKTPTPDEWTSASIHIYTGFTILGLTILRLILRFAQGAPEAPADEPALFRFLSKAAHGLLYLLLIAMPITGISKVYWGVDFNGFLHSGPLKLVLWALLIGHIAAVFVHKFYWRTNVLERMTRG
jgi:cytochrome b561